MPGTEDLKEFVENRLLAYDPDIDLTEGSPAQEQVVDPIVNRYAVDPLEMDIEKFIDARLSQEYPNMNFREGSGVRDTLVKPDQVLMDPVVRETNLIKQGQSLANPELLSDTEADSLVANIFVTRTTGGLSTGTVRLYFNAPVAVNISVGNVAYTAAGLRFLPTTLQSISAEAMIFNQSGSLYYFDIQVTAEKAGDEYNIGREEIIGITNLNIAVRVTNPERFENGINEETTEELIDRAEISITERSLVTGRGVAARLYDQFEDLKHLQVVGHYDEEMQRDIIKGGDLGPVLLSGSDGYTEDDGDGDSATRYFKSRYADFAAFFGALGAEENHYLTVSQAVYGTDGSVPASALNHLIIPGAEFTAEDVGIMIVAVDAANPGNIGPVEVEAISSDVEVRVNRTGVAESGTITYILLRPPKDYEILEVVGTSELRVSEDLPVDRQALIWSVRQKVLTLSDIPGGILFSINGEVEIQSDEIHIGGASDFYIRGTGVEERELTIAAISDEIPVLRALTGETDTSVGYEEFFRDQNQNFVALGVQPGMSLVIESGVDAGTKTILRVGVKPAGAAVGTETQWLQVEPSITSTATDLRYKIVDDIDINLNEPKTRRGEGTDLQTIQLSDTVTTLSAVDFLALGTEVDDTLKIVDGDDEGEYTVTGTSGTGNKNLILSALMVSTANNISWELYKAQEGIEFPLVRIRSVDILDSSEQPTGDIIPYAVPIDARSTCFSNAGRGIKVSTGDAITGIVATTSLDDLVYPLAAAQLDFSVNGGATQSVVVTGATGKTDLVNKINAVIPNIAGFITITGKDYLTIRSGDRWIQVLARADNAVVGLDTTGEDNRQIKSSGNISDWTSATYDLKAVKDAVSITTGDNIGYLYLVAVETDRILAVGFDEGERRLRFLAPGTRVSMSVGSRSYGKARVYFLDPTSFQVRGAWHPPLKNTTDIPANMALTAGGSSIAVDEEDVAYFTATINGTNLRFFPDPDLKHQVLPPSGDGPPNNLLTSIATPNFCETDSTPSLPLGQNSRDPDIDFLQREVRVGDLLEVTYQPIQGNVDLTTAGGFSYGDLPADDIPSNPPRTLTLSLDGAPSKTLTFSDQVTNEDDLVGEINDFWGEEFAFLEDIGGAKYLRLEADYEIVLYGGIANQANVILGLPPTTATNAAFAGPGLYAITYVGDSGDPAAHNALEVSPAFSHPLGVGAPAQHFIVYRPGLQRLHSTAMAENVEVGLYYMDVELVSEGSGDDWNIPDGELLDIEGYESDGYRLVVADSNLSYSTEEQVAMILSRRILTVGSSDRPDQALTLSGQNIQVNYDRSPLVSSVQAFASADLERVLTASLLVRHLQPHYLNFEILYRGGSSADVVTDDVDAYLDGLGPEDRVESSDLQGVAIRRGATYVQNPITLVAVAHDAERRISVDRSEDYVTTGRLSTFFSGDITITREIPESL
jgi:hypothetical protein